MKVPTVKISEVVYAEIAKRGKFGETVDDVLRREFGLDGKTRRSRVSANRARHAVRRMTPRVAADASGGELEIEFEGGVSKRFALPAPGNELELRQVREQALAWADSEGASQGQLNYITKELNRYGYYLRGPQL